MLIHIGYFSSEKNLFFICSELPSNKSYMASYIQFSILKKTLWNQILRFVFLYHSIIFCSKYWVRQKSLILTDPVKKYASNSESPSTMTYGGSVFTVKLTNLHWFLNIAHLRTKVDVVSCYGLYSHDIYFAYKSSLKMPSLISFL